MALPNVIIKLGNGNLGRVTTTDDGVVGLVLTGTAVAGKLELNKPYVLGGTRDLATLGITAENNPLVYKDIKAFYSEAGEGAELHLIVTSSATTLTQMCAAEVTSPLSKLIESASGRIRVVGVNKIAPEEYTAELTQGIDGDAITAVEAAHKCAESFAERVYPFRVIMAAPKWDGATDKLYKPSEASYNRVAMVLASDDGGTSAAIGQVLGRAARVEPQQSLGRVKDGAIATKGHYTDGSTVAAKAQFGNLLHDAGYIIYRTYPTRNGIYLNGSPMCAPRTDDYSTLSNGRIIDKASVIAYDTYISEVLDNIQVDTLGKLSAGACASYSAMLESALYNGMGTQVSSLDVSIDSTQDILSTGVLDIVCEIIPLGTMETIQVNLSFNNPLKTS